jgi:hypothetical protein
MFSFVAFIAAAQAAYGALAFLPTRIRIQLFWIPIQLLQLWGGDIVIALKLVKWGLQDQALEFLFGHITFTFLMLWLMSADFSLIKLLNTQEVSRTNHAPFICSCGTEPGRTQNGNAMHEAPGIQMRPVIVEATMVQASELPQATASQLVQATVVTFPTSTSQRTNI